MNAEQRFCLNPLDNFDYFLDEKDPERREELALYASVHKWARLSDSPGVVSSGAENCGLCALYLENVCQSCPVSKATSKTGCCGTPYNDYENEYDDYVYLWDKDKYNPKRYAEDMHQFLMDLFKWPIEDIFSED